MQTFIQVVRVYSSGTRSKLTLSIYLLIQLTLNESLQTFIQVVRVPAYISTIISAAADEGSDEIMCFTAGLHYLSTFPTRMSKISQKSMFSEKGCPYIAIHGNFAKGRMDG